MSRRVSKQSQGTQRPAAIPGSKQTLVQAFRAALDAAWNPPQPLSAPQVDPELPNLPFVERSAEVMRYHLLRLEYALSAGGTLREYIKFNLRLALSLIIPSILLGAALTVALWFLVSASNLLLAFVVNILLTLIALVAIALIVSGALFVIRLGR